MPDPRLLNLITIGIAWLSIFVVFRNDDEDQEGLRPGSQRFRPIDLRRRVHAQAKLLDSHLEFSN